MVKKFCMMLVLLAASSALYSCTVREAVKMSLADSPEQALKEFAKQKVETYKDDPLQALDDLKRAKKEYDRTVTEFKLVTGLMWGRDEVKVSTQKKYVKYTQNYKSRTEVDFDAGTVQVETIDTENVQTSLKNAIVTTLLTPDDPQAVDLFSDKEIMLSGTPYLAGLVEGQDKKPITDPADAERYAEHLIKDSLQTKEVSTDDGKKIVSFVMFGMVSDHTDRSARKYQPVVAKYADKFNVSRSLVLAVIKTESNFNPYAVSHVPAYGLMQLVPSSGGRDAYRRVNGVDRAPTKDYLFVAENNIELGTAYIDLIMSSFLEGIADPVSREYCAIASYNTGTGNMFKAFSRNGTRESVDRINAMHPSEVYERLKEHLPYEETRSYIVKVVNSRKKYVRM